MSISEKIAKKPIKKGRLIDYNSEQSYGFTIQKELQEDFKVYEYVHQHPNERQNMQQYITLLNNMLTTKKSRTKRKQYLSKIARWQLQLQTKKTSKTPNASNQLPQKSHQIDIYYTQQQYIKLKNELDSKQLLINQLMQQQQQINRILYQDVNDKNKSLNIIKGDINHIINRFDAISGLQKKINKVNSNNHNLFQHVYSVLLKDKKKIYFRQELQKQFYNKLKKVQNIQHKNLKKYKSNYFQSMNQKKEIFDKLKSIQKKCTSVTLYSDQIQLKEQKNYKSIQIFQLLIFVCNSINQLQQLISSSKCKQANINQFSLLLSKIFCYKNYHQNKQSTSTIDEITQQKLTQMLNKIIDEYKRLQYEIAQKKKQYSQYINNIQQQWTQIIKDITKQKQLQQQYNLQQKYQLSNNQFSIKQYFYQLNAIQQHNKVIFILFDLFSKKLESFNGLCFITAICSNQFYHLKIQQNSQSQQRQLINVFTEIQRNLAIWFSALKIAIKQCKKQRQRNPSNFVNTPCTYKQDTLEKDLNQSEMTKKEPTDYATRSYIEFGAKYEAEEQNNEDDEQQISQNTILYKIENPLKQQLGNSKSQENKKIGKETVKRLQMIQKIDQTYYNMIKQTNKMEKQNTKKNFIFQPNYQTFQFIPQDEIFQQKRFQSSFWGKFNKQTYGIKRQTTTKLRSKLQYQNMNRTTKGNQMNFNSLHTSMESSKNSQFVHGQSRVSTWRKNATFWEKDKKIKLSRVIHQPFGKVRV